MDLTIFPILQAELKDKLAAYNKYAVTRNISFPKALNKIHVAIGMRRSGKTWLLLQTINQKIQKHKIPLSRILYINLEDDRFIPCQEEKLRQILEGFYQYYPDNHHQVCYFFLDEIQNASGWANIIRRFFDTKNVKIYLSGSSAKLLSKEIASSLRGRSIATEVWPYDFTEYLSITPKTPLQLRSQAWIDTNMYNLKQYLHTGGFPEVFQIPEINRRQLLQDYVEIVVARDLIDRYQITNISLVKYLIAFLLKNTGGCFSVNKLANDIRSQGLAGSRNTIYEYISHIEDAYLAFPTPLFSESIRKIHSNPRKCYSIDGGLVRAFSLSTTNNYGHLFENMIFLYLKRLKHKVFYYLTKERYEVDFLTEDPFGKLKLYQVVWDDSDPKTLAREQRALNKAQEELQIEGIIITPKSFLEKILLPNHLRS